MNYIFFAIQCLCVSISFNVLLFHNSVGVTCLLTVCTVTDNTRDGYSMLPSIRTVPVSGHLKQKLNF